MSDSFRTYPYDGVDPEVPRDEDWERGRTRFVRTSVKGIQDWLLGLDRDEVKFWRTRDRHIISFGKARRGGFLKWYFLAPNPEGNEWINFILVKATPAEVAILQRDLSRRPTPTRSDGSFSFNVYNDADLDIVKRIIISRFNDWAKSMDRPDLLLSR